MHQWEIQKLSAFGKMIGEACGLAGAWEVASANSSGDILNGEMINNVGPEKQDDRVLLIVCVVCGLIAVIMVLLAVLAVLRKNRRASRQTDTAMQGAGIPLRLEIYAGRCRNKTAFLALSDVLTIGSSGDCDIVFDDPGMAPVNSSIKLDGGEIYIEDLDSSRGTALDGMRIQGRNKLRGGEVISIGTAEFAVFFGQGAEPEMS